MLDLPVTCKQWYDNFIYSQTHDVARSDAAYSLDLSLGVLGSVACSVGKVEIQKISRSERLVFHYARIDRHFFGMAIVRTKGKTNPKLFVLSITINRGEVSSGYWDKDAYRNELWVPRR